ncbi:uncharacterized protein [Argopecten irradians]|uniref:uncharacterized protein n=1 Tax=Argopecten irradians TaxID=31199 RepID=UPI0037225832
MYSILLFTTLVGLSVTLSHYETYSLMREIQLIRQEQLNQIKTCQHNIDYIVRENKAIQQRMVVLESENRVMLDKLSRFEEAFRENEKSSLTNSIRDTTAGMFHTKFNDIPLSSNELLQTHEVASSTELEEESYQETTRSESGMNTEQRIRCIDTELDTQQPIRTIDTITDIHQSMIRQSESHFLTPTKERSVTDSKAGETGCSKSKKLIKRVGSASNAVGFYAALAPDVSLGDQEDVKFDHVYTNLGQGYEPSDGHFRAPVAGLYLLSATVLSAGTTPDDMLLELVKNGANVGQIYATKSLNEGSRVIVLSLDVGDMVWVRHMSGDPGTVANGAHYSTFSGVLISAFGSTSSS